MEAQISEPSTYEVDSFARSWFEGFPIDSRFINCSYHRFMPTSSIDAKTITFDCARFEAPNCYIIQGIYSNMIQHKVQKIFFVKKISKT